MEPFEDIDNITIERFYQNYTKSNNDPQYRIVYLGEWTVDIACQIKYPSDEPENTQMHRFIIRGKTHHRARPENSRFGGGSLLA